MSGQIQSLVDGQAPDTDILVHTVRIEVKLVLPLHFQPSPHGTQPRNSLQDTLKKVTSKPHQTTIAGSFSASQAGPKEHSLMG